MLGPLRLVVDDVVVEVPGAKRRAVLALLALAQGRVVVVDHLLGAVWRDDPPGAARAALHSHISRLRGHLGAAASLLESVPGGYRLALSEGSWTRRSLLAAASALNDRLGRSAVSPTVQAMHHYVAGEIDSAAGRRDLAEEHYASAIELARAGGSTFTIGIASVGLLTVRADAGRVDDALGGYRDVIDYWERTGSWIPQWTTLRNLARLLHTLGDHEPALFLEVAADHAPEASAVSDVVWNPATPTVMYDLGDEIASRIRSEASRCARDRVLEVARQSIDRHLTG